MKTIPRPQDNRHGVSQSQEGSCIPTYTTTGRDHASSALGNPAQLMDPEAGTMTRAQYLAWSY